MMKESGERHLARHACLSGVHWNTPARRSSTPPSRALVLVMAEERRPASCSRHCASAAAAA
jgi:hypothetical protein